MRNVGLLAWVVLALSLLCMGCSGPGSSPEVNRQEVEKFLLDYLPKLGEAYRTRQPELLEGLAVPKEISKITLRTNELSAAGRVYEPEFKQLTVENVSVWNYSNALVTTLEVWDVRAYSVGQRVLVNESLGQRNRVKYQLKRKEDSWVVLFRELDQTFDQ